VGQGQSEFQRGAKVAKGKKSSTGASAAKGKKTPDYRSDDFTSSSDDSTQKAKQWGSTPSRIC
jgi:hypothetical protein